MGVTLGFFDGGRAAADSLFDFVITADGFYPVRVAWWEGNEGANIELFSQDLVTGVNTLINDAATASSIRAYRESSVIRPYVSRVLPVADQLEVLPNADVLADITDGTIPVNAASIKLSVNGASVNATPTKVGNVTMIKRPGSLASPLLT